MGPEAVIEDLVIGLLTDPDGHTVGMIEGQ